MIATRQQTTRAIRISQRHAGGVHTRAKPSQAHAGLYVPLRRRGYEAPPMVIGVETTTNCPNASPTFEPDTGKLLREERLKDALGDYYASPVGGDGKVYFINKEGKTTTISAGTAWKVLSSGDLAEQVIATPAIADGRIYVRTEGTLYSFGLKAP